jgi:hypothetical protein
MGRAVTGEVGRGIAAVEADLQALEATMQQATGILEAQHEAMESVIANLRSRGPRAFDLPAGFEAIARLARTLPAISRAQLPWLNGSYYSSSLTLLAALANDDLLEREQRQQSAAGEAAPLFLVRGGRPA